MTSSEGSGDPAKRSPLDRIREPVRRWPLRSVGLVALTVAIAAAAIAVSGPNGRIATLNQENVALSRQLDDATANASTTNDELAATQADLSRVRRKLARIGDLEQRKRSLSQQISDLAGRVKDEQAQLTTVKAEVAKSSFGDGTWQSGVDFIPGTYQAPGGDSCYWAKLSSPSGRGIDNIIDNGGFNTHEIVSVDSPYFETRDCGTWRRTG